MINDFNSGQIIFLTEIIFNNITLLSEYYV